MDTKPTTLGVILLLCLFALTARAANPSFNDFNTNQFDTTGNKVRILNGAVFTNVTIKGGTFIGDGGGLTNLSITSSNAGSTFPWIIVTNGITNLLLQAVGGVVWADANGMLTNIPPQTANTIFAGPANGAPAQPLFRSLAIRDMPSGVAQFSINNTFFVPNFFDSLWVTNGLTNLSLTANTVLKSGASKDEESIPNGLGALTNNGSGVVGYYDLTPLVSTNDPRNLTLSGATNYLGTDLASSNYWGNVSHAVGFPVGGVAASPTITITTNGNQVTPALANPLIISELDISDLFSSNLTIGGVYYSTNPYPIVAGTALEMDKSYQFVITNNAVNITGFTATSNNLVNIATIGISNSAAGSIPFTFPTCLISGGGTLSSYTIPSATTIFATFTLWASGTNVNIWGTANGLTLPGTNTTIAVTDQYKTNVYNAMNNSHYFSNSVGWILLTADGMTWSNSKTGNYLVWTNGGMFSSNVVTGAWSQRTNDSVTLSNLQGAVTILTNLSLALTNRTAANTGSLVTSSNVQVWTGTTGSNQLNNAANTAPVTVLTNGGGWFAQDVEFGGFIRGVAGGGSYLNQVEYSQTNNFPLNPGAINLDWRAAYQFITTNASFTLNGFINASNNIVNQVNVSVSNSSASSITFTWGGAPIRMYGTNTSSSGPIPAGKVWKGLFQLDPHGTNLISPLMQSN